MVRRRLIAAFCLILTTGTAEAGTEIRLWHALGGALADILNGQVEQFNRLQEDVTVKADYKGTYAATMAEGLAAARAGHPPHIIQVFDVGTATMMAAWELVVPVQDVMALAGESFDAKVYLPAISAYYSTADGRLLSLPYNASTPVLYYNKDALRAAGLNPARPPRSWEEMERVLPILKAAGSTCPFTTTWQSWIHLENLSAYHNQPLGTRSNGFDGRDAVLAFNAPLQVRHIATLARWVAEGLFVPFGRTNEANARFGSGQCAMMTESSAGYAQVRAAARFAWGVAPLPYWSQVRGAPWNTIVGGASLWVMAGHPPEQQAAVARFFTFLSRPEVQAAYHQASGYLPTTAAAYEQSRQEGFYERNPGTDVSIKQLRPPTAHSRGLRFGDFARIRTAIDEELDAVWADRQNAQQALDNAVIRGNEILRQFERDHP